MKANYLLTIDEPHTHQVHIRLNLTEVENEFDFFLPSWSPGSYLMREYSKHMSCLKVLDDKGNYLEYEKTAKGIWRVFNPTAELSIEYKMYCHELTVRTSHVDASHAFLHGPSLFAGVKDVDFSNIKLELRFPALWSKVLTGLNDISKNRETFLYKAKDYDELLDCPIEIGCHESDGFKVQGKDHHLAFYGKTWPHKNNLKSDIKKIVETVADFMGEIPYEHYSFITHFKPDIYGGLEHLNSTVLAFDGRKLHHRKDYMKWLCLVTHEYFHTWNVKRIRPVELGPFDYTNENYTSMLWLVEGLTSFIDNYLTWKSGLISEQEYWGIIKEDLNIYYKIQGRKFDSLESSSFDAWIKLYRPHENSRNSTISYYLKGGLVFLILHARLLKINKSIKDLIDSLWKHYKSRPEQGINKKEFLQLLLDISNKEIVLEFEKMIETTEELDFQGILKECDIDLVFSKPIPELGVNPRYENNKITIASIRLDSVAHKIGLNAADEIVQINDLKVTEAVFKNIKSYLDPEAEHTISVLRAGEIVKLSFRLAPGVSLVKSIQALKSSSW